MFEKEKKIGAISKESAEEILKDFYEYYDVDFDEIDEEKSKSLKSHKEKLISAVMRGRLEIKRDDKDDVVIVQHIGSASEKLEYSSQVGKAFLAMKKYESNDHMGRAYAMLGSLAGMNAEAISQLKPVDLKVALAIGLTLIEAVM